MNCISNTIFAQRMQNLIWDDILKNANDWETFCHDKSKVSDFMAKSQTIICIDCLIEKLGAFGEDFVKQENYKQLKESWEATKKNIKIN